MSAQTAPLRVEYVRIASLRPFEGNPRKISEKGLEKLQREAEERGFDTVTRLGYYKRKGERVSYKPIICEECGQPVWVRSDTHPRFCSVSCQSRNGWRTGRIKAVRDRGGKERRICKHCGESFLAHKSDQRVYCGRECREADRARGRLERICRTCGKSFAVRAAAIEKTNASGTYCSRACRDRDYQERFRGAGNPNYSGGPVDGSRVARIAWRRRRERLIARWPVCWACGRKHNLDVHHLIPWRLSRTDAEWNLAVLCRKCHRHVEALTRRAERRGLDLRVVAIVIKLGLKDRMMAMAAEALRYAG